MKFSTMIAGALATIASAAPTKEIEQRSFFGQGNVVSNIFGGGFNNGLVNNFAFQDPLFGYLGAFNNFDPRIAQLLFTQNFVGADSFLPLFSFQGNGNLDFSLLLQLQNLLFMQWLFQQQIITSVNFAGISPPILDFGVLGNQFNFNQFRLDPLAFQNVLPTIQTFVQSNAIIFKE